MSELLQKILSQWGIASRREAEKMILSGRVKLNGAIVDLGQKANPQKDRIEVDGIRLQSTNRPKSIYLLLYKPTGVVSTCSDPKKRSTVLDLLPPKLRENQGIHPVGRLDAETTGALLLTNDGEMTFHLTHPRHCIPKTYEVWVEGHPSKSVLQAWRQGVMLFDQKTLPAQVKILGQQGNQTLLQIVLKEGRNRQIRHVAEQLGHPVLHLHRSAIGSIQLEQSGVGLNPGQYRPLKDFEIRFLQDQINLTSVEVPADLKERRV